MYLQFYLIMPIRPRKTENQGGKSDIYRCGQVGSCSGDRRVAIFRPTYKPLVFRLNGSNISTTLSNNVNKTKETREPGREIHTFWFGQVGTCSGDRGGLF